MAHVIVEVTGVSSVCIGSTICSYGGKYGIDVDDNTIETLKRLQANGYIKLTLSESPAPIMEEDIPELIAQILEVTATQPEPVIDEPVIDEPVIDEPVIEEPVIEKAVIASEPVVEASVIPQEPVKVEREVKNTRKKRTASV